MVCSSASITTLAPSRPLVPSVTLTVSKPTSAGLDTTFISSNFKYCAGLVFEKNVAPAIPFPDTRSHSAQEEETRLPFSVITMYFLPFAASIITLTIRSCPSVDGTVTSSLASPCFSGSNSLATTNPAKFAPEVNFIFSSRSSPVVFNVEISGVIFSAYSKVKYTPLPTDTISPF